MKILIIRNYPSYLDVKNNIYNIQEVGLAKALVRRNNTCDIVFWTDKEEEDVEIPVDNCGSVHVFYRKGKTLLKNTVYTGCKELFAKYDVLQPCEYNQMQAWLLAKKYPNKTVIYHGPYYSAFNKRYNLMCKVFDAVFLKTYIRQGSKFIVKSKMAEEFLNQKGIHSDNICVAGVGLDAQMLSNGNNVCEEKLYIKMQQDESELKLLYVGRFEERRNLFFILDVFAKVHLENSKSRLYLIGTGDKAYIHNVFKYAETLGIRDDISWQERMEQKYLSNIYQLADFFLLPTEYDIFGMVLLEAMYYKAVVLTTRNGGSSTLIQDGKNGYILEAEDATKWSKCILSTSQNRPLMKQIEDNASNIIKHEFTWDSLAERFMMAYAKRVKGGK